MISGVLFDSDLIFRVCRMRVLYLHNKMIRDCLMKVR